MFDIINTYEREDTVSLPRHHNFTSSADPEVNAKDMASYKNERFSQASRFALFRRNCLIYRVVTPLLFIGDN